MKIELTPSQLEVVKDALQHYSTQLDVGLRYTFYDVKEKERYINDVSTAADVIKALDTVAK